MIQCYQRVFNCQSCIVAGVNSLNINVGLAIYAALTIKCKNWLVDLDKKNKQTVTNRIWERP